MVAVAMAPAALMAQPVKSDPSVVAGNATQGFKILAEDYTSPSLLDVMSLEWQYFMVHAEGAFSGIVSVILVDPRFRLPSLMPSGGNAVISGKFGTGDCDDKDAYCVTDFVNVGKNTEATSYPNPLYFYGYKDTLEETDTYTMSVADDGDSIHFAGSSEHAAWNLTIEQDWVDREPLTPLTGRDLGTLPGEFWTVNMLWPRTKIAGTMLCKHTGTTYKLGDGTGEVKAHGYRENSFGRWLFALDGWDFAIFSSEESQVQVAWQSYHNGKELDAIDISFPESDGFIKTVHFSGMAGEVGWFHNEWSFHEEARQCVPRDGFLEAANNEYYMRAELDIGNSQVPMLSKATPVTSIYVIMEWIPTMHGHIYRQRTGELVASFSGIAGGEISFKRAIVEGKPEEKCVQWGKPTYMSALTVPVSVPGVTRDQCAQVNSGIWWRDIWTCGFRRDCRWDRLRRRCY